MRFSIRLSIQLLLFGGLRTFAETPLPNIVFIMTDDLGYGDLGVFYQDSRNFAINRDQPAFDTPVLDTLASEGLQFTHHYCGSPVCAPSRASFLTGRHQGHATVRDNQFDAPLEDTETVASVLKEAGYATVAIGKWGLGGSSSENYPAHPMDRGFDYYFGVMAHRDAHSHYFDEFNINLHDGRRLVQNDYDLCYSTDLFTARAKKWIVDHQTAAPDQPFLLYLAYTAPHARLQVPTQAYPSGSGQTGGMQWLGTPGNMISTASGTIDSWIHPDYANATWDHDGNPDTPEVAWPEASKRHATMIRRVDTAVGDLQQLFQDLGIGDNTLVVFSSDNGPHHEAGYQGTFTQDPRFFGSFGPLDGTKRDLWEGGWRVPTLVHWPSGIPVPGVISRPSQFHDWLPTFAELAGVNPPAKSDGVSLLPEITGQGTQEAGIQYSEYTTVAGLPATQNYSEFDISHRGAVRGHMQALYLNGVKGVRYNVQNTQDTFRVYETDGDPQETVNLAGGQGVPDNDALVNATLWLRRPHATISRPYDTAMIPAQDSPFREPTVKVFPGIYHWVPRITSNPARTQTDLPGTGVLEANESAALEFEGTLNIPVSGAYTFYLRTDTGAVVRLHDMLLLDADKGYTPGSVVNSGTLHLQQGMHPLRVYSRHSGSSPFLELEWEGAVGQRQRIPASAFTNMLVNLPPELDIQSPLGSVQILPDTGLKIAGSISDDGLPGTAPLRTTWSVLQTPDGGTVDIDPVAQVNSSVSFDTPGFYRLQCTVSDGSLFTSKTLDVLYGGNALTAPPDPSLWYPFSATLEDRAGSNNGVGSGTLTFGAGARNGSLRFEKANAFVDTTSPIEIADGAPWSFSAWFRLENVAGTNSILLQQLDGTGTGRTWLYVVDDNGTFRVGSYIGGVTTRGGVVELDQWHHVAMVVSGASLTLYLDGNQVAKTSASLEANTGKFRVGNFKTLSADRQWIGSVADIALYSRALTKAEIEGLSIMVGNSAPGITLHLPAETVGYKPFPVQAVATDDMTAGSALTYLWSALPGEKVSFSDDTQASATSRVSASGLFRFRVDVGDGNATSFAVGSVSVISPGEIWREKYFGTAENSGNAADDADPNANGVPNLYERAFGTDPVDPESGIFPKLSTVVDLGLTYAGLEFPRLTGGNWMNDREYRIQDLTYRLRGGNNLMDQINWPVLPLVEVSTENTGTPPETEVVHVRTHQDITSINRFFLRLEVISSD